ncbi:MAG: nucleotidyltransferase family protein [Candidatus Lokiarchaeia archaeon]
MKNLEKVEKILKKHKEYLRNKFYIEKIGVFGSYSKGTQKNKSDIDIFVEFYHPIGWKFFTLKQFLENILGMKVDLATKNSLRPQMKEEVLKDVIYV